MPIYEYVCQTCHGHFQKLLRSFTDTPEVQCPRCASAAVQRVMSQVAPVRSTESDGAHVLTNLAQTNIDENDPRAVARWAKELGRTLGDDAGNDWDEMVDQVLDEERQRDASGSSGTRGDDLGWA